MKSLGDVLARLNGRRPRLRHKVGRWAIIYPSVKLYGAAITIGDTAVIRRDSLLFGPIVIGDNTFINQGAYIRAGTQIGNDVAIGPFVRLITDSHQIGPSRRRAGHLTSDPIIVGDGAWLGAGVLVLPGVTIGPGAVVAAGSVVTRNVAPDTLVAGNPARLIRQLADPPDHGTASRQFQSTGSSRPRR